MAAVVVATASGCTGPTPSPSSTAPSSSSSADSAPSVQTLDADELTQKFQTLAGDMAVPGAAMLLITPEGEYSATYGTTTLVSLDDHVRIGSNRPSGYCTATIAPGAAAVSKPAWAAVSNVDMSSSDMGDVGNGCVRATTATGSTTQFAPAARAAVSVEAVVLPGCGVDEQPTMARASAPAWRRWI